MIDDMAVNIDGAVSAGMQGIIFNTVQQAKVELARLMRINNA
jgi:FMN phosphatase YigB (HAD superfamily)